MVKEANQPMKYTAQTALTKFAAQLSPLKIIGGSDVSTWIANTLVGLHPHPTLVPTQGQSIQTEWEIGRSLEGKIICSDPKSRGRTTGLHLPPQGKRTGLLIRSDFLVCKDIGGWQNNLKM